MVNFEDGDDLDPVEEVFAVVCAEGGSYSVPGEGDFVDVDG